MSSVSRILLQTTITECADDWDVSRFSMVADELRACGHHVTARNRSCLTDDPVLARLDELDFDQLWLLAVDVGDGLTAADADGIRRFRERGGGVLTARDHQDLGCCLNRLGILGVVNEFHDETVDPRELCDDQDNPHISWPNYHSGANGDYQPVWVDGEPHELLRTNHTASGHIEWFPAHPHEGMVTAKGPYAQAIARGRSTATGRHFNLAIVVDGERCPAGRPMGRVVAESTFHHFADYNWDLAAGAPSFVSDLPGTQIKDDPSRLAVFKDYVANIARWLHPVSTTEFQGSHQAASRRS